MPDDSGRDYEPTKIYLSALFEEYRAIREHGKQANIFRGLIMQVGAALCAAVITAAASQWNNPNGVAPLLLLVVVPILASVSLLTWVGEARVFGRTRVYASLVERKVLLIVQTTGLPKGLVERWPAEQRRLEEELRMDECDPVIGPIGWEAWGRSRRVTNTVARFRDSTIRNVLSAMRFGFLPAVMLLSLVLGHLQLATVPTNAFGRNGWRILTAIGYVSFVTSVSLGLLGMWDHRGVRFHARPRSSPQRLDDEKPHLEEPGEL
jgi:hypothetical protein